MLNTIKLPRNFAMLKGKLPASQYTTATSEWTGTGSKWNSSL